MTNTASKYELDYEVAERLAQIAVSEMMYKGQSEVIPALNANMLQVADINDYELVTRIHAKMLQNYRYRNAVDSLKTCLTECICAALNEKIAYLETEAK